MARSTKHARETEIARRLALLLERVPLKALHNLLANLSDGIAEALAETQSQQTPNATRGWKSHDDPSGSIQFLSPCSLSVEVVPQAVTYLDRFDLAMPIPPSVIAGRVITSIVFEFKLHLHNLKQLQKYAGGMAPNSLIVSVSKEATLAQLVRVNDESPIVFQTWEHLYFALQSMLSGDAAPRVAGIEEPADLLLKFDHRVAGQDRLAFEIESFLELLLTRDLLPSRELVLAVPLGAHAKETLKQSPPYYVHSDSWRAGYRYLVALWRNEITHIYEVLESVTTNAVGDTPGGPPETLPQAEWVELASLPGSRVSVLKPLDATHARLGRYLKKKYSKKGPQGHAAAFTQTHRYLERPEELENYFI
jgi:hypothetical protein